MTIWAEEVFVHWHGHADVGVDVCWVADDVFLAVYVEVVTVDIFVKFHGSSQVLGIVYEYGVNRQLGL